MAQLSYKLAKKLKDVGFPQKNPLIKLLTNAKSRYSEMRLERLWYGIDGFYRYSDEAEFEDWIIIPTLEELIEACGEIQYGFELRRGVDKEDEDAPVWIASGVIGIERFEFIKDTPIEAVANLWLKLNKNG